ncbi:MAG: HD domain-containing phosphohydrolase [Methylophilus sp.]|nr:HD domain-containing phosphohydrolase [Methylophilus sp.]
MDKRRISVSDITVGEALPWDVTDASGRLLLHKGYVVERMQQVEALVERGMFIETAAIASKPEIVVEKPKEAPSALHFINLINKRLERLLLNINSEPDLEAKLLEVVKSVNHACEINADVAHACILLNPEGSSYPVRHCVDTAIVAVLIAKALKKSPDEIVALTAASLTMNVSMIQLQNKLQHQQTELTVEERRIINSHPHDSVNALKERGIDNKDWLSFIALHHENEDGSGYPNGLTGDAVPQSAKIISLADRYCARISSRSYRKALLPNSALRDMLVTDKEHINPMLIKCFIDVLGVYPAGTFVRLENGETAVVTGKGESTTTPIVHSFIGARGDVLVEPFKRDTSKPLCSIREVISAEQANFRFSMQRFWGDSASL